MVRMNARGVFFTTTSLYQQIQLTLMKSVDFAMSRIANILCNIKKCSVE